MRLTNLQKFSLGALVLTFAASCSISTSMDATIKRQTEAAIKATIKMLNLIDQDY